MNYIHVIYNNRNIYYISFHVWSLCIDKTCHVITIFTRILWFIYISKRCWSSLG